jgi:hypothetical protein
MRVNPFYDSWLFLIGEDAFHLGIGPWRYLLVALYWALAIASVYLAYRNWQADPAQRTKAHLGTWLARALIGTMWFEGSLWKLPIPSGGFKYWLEQEGKYAAWGFYQDFVTSVLLPGFTAQLYIGLYRNPSEWPWAYVFIIVINWLFYIYAAGRSLGLDALLRRETTVEKGDGIVARLYRWAS